MPAGMILPGVLYLSPIGPPAEAADFYKWSYTYYY